MVIDLFYDSDARKVTSQKVRFVVRVCNDAVKLTMLKNKSSASEVENYRRQYVFAVISTFICYFCQIH